MFPPHAVSSSRLPPKPNRRRELLLELARITGERARIEAELALEPDDAPREPIPIYIPEQPTPMYGYPEPTLRERLRAWFRKRKAPPTAEAAHG